MSHEQMTLVEDLKRAAWARTSPVAGQLNSWEFRKDCLGNLVRYQDYGKRTSPFGWELDFILSRALGGACDDDLFLCNAGLQCVGVTATVDGTCQPVGGEGEGCVRDRRR